MSTVVNTAENKQSIVVSESQRSLEQRHRDRLNLCLFEFENRANVAEQKLAACQEHMGRVHLEYLQMRDSSSWRLTSPLRKVVLSVRRLANKREIINTIVTIAKSVGSRHPKLRSAMLRFLARFPSIEAGVRKLDVPGGQLWSAQNSDYAESIHSLEQLPDPARQIYSQLKAELRVRHRL